MTGSTRIPPTEITGVFGTLLEAMSRRMFGQVPKGAGVLWHYPRLLKDAMGFGRGRVVGPAGPRPRLVRDDGRAATVGCSFCLDLHYFLSRDRGLDEAEAREVPRWRESRR